MGDKLVFERFAWFHDRVKSGKHPNARTLAEEFELSYRTAQRDIEFMRDRLGAPLAYDCDRRGYRYTDASYELPPQWFDENSVMALALAVRLSSAVPDKRIKHNLCSLLDRMLGRRRGGKLCFDNIAQKISVKNIEYSKVEGGMFHRIFDALFRERPLSISYYSPHKDERTQRLIMPLHLLHYMGSWHVVVYCTKRKGLRDFALARIKSAAHATEAVELPDDLPSVKKYVRRNFGIMQGGKTFRVRLLFSSAVAGWISEQIWHPQQEMTVVKGGSLLMGFHASDLREIKRRVLAHGADVKVLAPKKLALEVEYEIKRMGKVY